MNITMEKIIKKLRKEYKGNINIQNIVDALKKQGYDVVFFNTDEGDEIAESYGVTEVLKKVNAITYSGASSIVFVDNNLHTQDKLYSLLHELGHIMLRHVGYGDTGFRDKRLIDMEAETFAYNVLYPPRKSKVLTIAILITACICFAGGGVAGQARTNKVNQTKEVCITRTGSAYHLDTCSAIKGKEYIYIAKNEAEKLFEPCGICNPQDK